MKYLYYLFIIFLPFIVFSQNKTLGEDYIHKNSGEGQRKALIIGNQTYKKIKNLENIYNDVDSMTVALEFLGFKCTTLRDRKLASLQDTFDDFINNLNSNDVVFIYYSGHGLGLLSDNWILPIDFDANCIEEVKNRAISLENVRKRIQAKEVRNFFLIVDACRDEAIWANCPNKSNTPTTQLVDIKQNPNGFLQVFATDYGQTATFLSKYGVNSLFTECLLIYIRQPLELNQIFNLAKNLTYKRSKELNQKNPSIPIQEPILNSRIYDDFYFIAPKIKYIDFEKVKPYQNDSYYPKVAPYLNKVFTSYEEELNCFQKIKSEMILCNQQLDKAKLNFNKDRFDASKFWLGAGIFGILASRPLYNIAKKSTNNLISTTELFDTDNDGSGDNFAVLDQYNNAVTNYNKKKYLAPVSNVMLGLGILSTSFGVYKFVSKKFKGINCTISTCSGNKGAILNITKDF